MGPGCQLCLLIHGTMSLHSALLFLIHLATPSAHMGRIVWALVQVLCRVMRQNEGEPAGAPSTSGSADVDMDTASEGMRPASAGTSYYRLGSVGQDCQLCLWDLVVPPQRHRLAHASRYVFALCTAACTMLPSTSRCSRCTHHQKQVSSSLLEPGCVGQQQEPRLKAVVLGGSDCEGCFCASSAGQDLNSRALRPPARQEPARRGWDSSSVREGSPKLLAKLSSSLHRDPSPSRHNRSDSSSSGCLPPEIVPATPRKRMHFIPAIAAIRHVPLCIHPKLQFFDNSYADPGPQTTYAT